MITRTVHYVHSCSIHRASKKYQFLSLSQTEGKSVSPRFLDRNFYIKFNILLVL